MSEDRAVSVEIWRDNLVFKGDFLSETAASEWVIEMVGEILKRYPLMMSSRFEIRRIS